MALRRAWPWIVSVFVTVAWASVAMLAAFGWEMTVVLSPAISSDMTAEVPAITASVLPPVLLAAGLGVLIGIVVAIALYFLYGKRRGPVFFAALAGPVLLYAVYIGGRAFEAATGEASVAWNPTIILGWTAVVLLPPIAAVAAIAFLSAGDVPGRPEPRPGTSS